MSEAASRQRPGDRWRDVDGILLLDKPEGLTSNAALQRARRAFRARKAGHTGSLDPLASGLLPICFGQATKASGMLLDADKTYRVWIALGERTTTGDREGEVVLGLAQLVLSRKSAVMPREILGRNTVRQQEGARRPFRRCGIHPVAGDDRQWPRTNMQLAEHLVVQLLDEAKRLDREIQPCVLACDLVPDHGKALQLHPVWLAALPGLETRLERVAVAAAVPETLDNLDAAG